MGAFDLIIETRRNRKTVKSGDSGCPYFTSAAYNSPLILLNVP